MDSEKIIIYVVIGIVYYGYRYFVKNFGTSKNAPKHVEPPVSNPSTFPERGREITKRVEPPQLEKSIFDLLEEIKKRENTSQPQTSYERLPEPAKSLEDTDYELESKKLVIEDVNPYKYAAMEGTAYSPNRDKAYSSEESAVRKKPHPILTTLKDPQKVKEAFILGEILTKRF